MTRAKLASAPSGWLSLHNLWLAGCLVLTALACAALAAMPGGKSAKPLQATAVTAEGETTIAPVDERIELAKVGTAVWSHNPSGEEDLEFGERVELDSWRHLILRAPKEDGSHCELNLLRPDWWVELEAAETGGEVYVSVPECGIDGDAEVLEILPCPPIQPTPPGYRTITGTFHHHNARVLDLHVSGLAEPIGVTPNHPFWSEEREEFVRADELQPGENLLGLAGFPKVNHLVVRDGSHDVYNLEVHCRHAYYVGKFGLLVHNSRTCADELLLSGNSARNRLGNALGGVAGDGLEAHHVIPWKFRDHDIVQRAARGGYNINGANNGLLLSPEKHQHNPFHPRYSNAVERRLDRFSRELAGRSDAEVASALQEYTNRLIKGIFKTTKGLR